MLHTHTIEVDEQPYLVEFTSIGKKGDPIGTINGFKYIATQINTKKPRLHEKWYCYTLHMSVKRKFVFVYLICTEEQYKQDPLLILPPRIREKIRQQQQYQAEV